MLEGMQCLNTFATEVGRKKSWAMRLELFATDMCAGWFGGPFRLWLKVHGFARLFFAFCFQPPRVRLIMSTNFIHPLELYDLSVDPNESFNVISQSAYSAVHSQFITLYSDYLQRSSVSLLPFDVGQSNEDASMLFVMTPQLPPSTPTLMPTPSPAPAICNGVCYMVTALISFSASIQNSSDWNAIYPSLVMALGDLIAARNLNITLPVNLQIANFSLTSFVQVNVSNLNQQAAYQLAVVIDLDHAYFTYVLKTHLLALRGDQNTFESFQVNTTQTVSPQVLLQPSTSTSSPSKSPIATPASNSPTSLTPTVFGQTYSPHQSPTASPNGVPFTVVPTTLCVDNVLCSQGKAWSNVTCTCVPSSPPSHSGADTHRFCLMFTTLWITMTILFCA